MKVELKKQNRQCHTHVHSPARTQNEEQNLNFVKLRTKIVKPSSKYFKSQSNLAPIKASDTMQSKNSSRSNYTNVNSNNTSKLNIQTTSPIKIRQFTPCMRSKIIKPLNNLILENTPKSHNITPLRIHPIKTSEFEQKGKQKVRVILDKLDEWAPAPWTDDMHDSPINIGGYTPIIDNYNHVF